MATMTTTARRRTAKVVDIASGKVERFAAEIAPLLREHGYVIVVVAEVESVELWRRAARRAGRLLGWRVFTKISSDGTRVLCGSDDFPVPPGSGRAAAETFAALLRGDTPTRPSGPPGA